MERAELSKVTTKPSGLSPAVLRARPEILLVPLTFVVIFGAWELAVRLLKIPVYILPAPSAILEALVRGLGTSPTSGHGYWIHAGYTLAEAVQGFILGSILGLVLGTIISQSPLVEKLFKPYIVAFQSLPKLALAPIFVIWFGFGMTSKVVICGLLTFFPLLVNTIAGLKGVDEERVELMKSLSASRWQIFRMVAFPSALPFIFAGLDVGIVYSILGAIVGEFVGAQQGLGVLLLQMNFQMDMAGAFSVFVLLSVMGVALSGTINAIRGRLLFWAPSERKQRTVGA